MNVKQATVLRFQEIMKVRNIRPNELANISGITPSTVYSMLDCDTSNLVKEVIYNLNST